MTNIILNKGYQILYLDQRGTGLSSTITADTLALQGDAGKQADYLKKFRADSIVRDCEAIRLALTEAYPEELKKWSVLGQSFGGFCALTYLSQRPHGLREVFLTGGLPPINKTADEVYTATLKQVVKRNDAYYAKFPEDERIVRDLAVHIHSKGKIELPSGGKLTVRGLLALGHAFGAHGGLDTVHSLVQRMKLDLETFHFLTLPTLATLEAALTFDSNILYAIMHESIYCEGEASNWSAERVCQKHPLFAWQSSESTAWSFSLPKRLYFTGEMIFPFMVSGSLEMVKPGMATLQIAAFKEWPKLYDIKQLAENKVPVYSACFVDDMYVDFGLAQETAALIKGCKQFITNSMYHNALRSKSSEVLEQLFALRDDSID